MVDESILKILRKLATGTVMLDAHSPNAEWREIADGSDSLAGALLAAGEGEAQDLAQAMGVVAGRVASGTVANPEAGIKAVRNIVGVLQGLETPAGMRESLRKQALAEATLFLKDVKKEESFVNAASFVDDEERREMIIALEQRVDDLDADLINVDPPEGDAEAVRSIFRQFHTLKGEGAICGIKSVAEFCHGIETEIEDARHGKLTLTHDVVSALQSLTGLIRPILAGKTRAEIGEDLVRSLMRELRDAVAASRDLGAAAPPSESTEPAADRFADFFAGFAPPPADDDKTAATDEEFLSALEEVDSLSETGGGAESPFGQGDAEESLDAVSALPDAAIAALAAPPTDETVVLAINPETPMAEAIRRSGDRPIRKSGSAPRPGADTVIESGEIIGPPIPKSGEREVGEKPVDATEVKAISIDVHNLDELIELVGEVSLLGSFFSSRLSGHPDLAVQANNLSRTCGRLQAVATALRMTSIRPLFMSVRRAAVEAARSSRKLIDINLLGSDTLVDRSIVENLSAALIHVIRNAVDHGIEQSADRRRAGKPERGVISISARRTDSDVGIELGDDGKGFDLESIRNKAVAMGKIPPDAPLTDEEIADLVFLPGLSTAKRITGLSGRGVGMEIVRESIDSLRGRVEVKTVPGKGSSVRMRFPLSVSAMEGMLVRLGRNILVLPVAQVRESFRPTAADIGSIEGRGAIVNIRGVAIPVLFLGREFGIAAEATRPEDGVLVVVEAGELLTAVLVDESIGTRQVMIRPLEGPLSKLPLVAGAAILPDRTIALVVETSRLTERVSIAAAKAFSEAGRRQADGSREVDTVSIGSNQVGVIDFAIGAPTPEGGAREHVFAINAFKTKEFVPVDRLQPLPGAPPGFAGMMLLRKRAIPVVHMGVVLGLLAERERRNEWEKIALVCEFAGKTVGFLVTRVNRVSYISWSDIMPPPATGGMIQLDYVVGSILMSRLKGTLSGREGGGSGADGPGSDAAQVAFVLDFERIVGNVIQLYGDMGSELGDMGSGRKGEVRILLVEDSPLIRKRTVKALKNAGIAVIEAGDGQEAWDKIAELSAQAKQRGESIFSRVDLVLSDIEMPRMDGYTFTRRLKRDPELRVLPVLLHSSITNDNMIKRSDEVEADGFIPKCDPKELAEQLRKYL
ncbi:MAG: chemotaxis protein CheW [Planctomycetota bacterium]|jgi:two-component system chemotaxis sensor kinase CheA|nr:chemotaxis protein CheW [Planctomycetota bacterium]